MSNVKSRYYIGFTVVLIALVAYIALAFQYSKVNADTFYNEIEKVISDYSAEILHEGDDSADSISHPLNRHLQKDESMTMRRDATFKYISVQRYSYVLTDMLVGVGYYGYEYETREQALMALAELDAFYTAMGARPIEVNGVAAYKAINPDDVDNVTYWQLTVHENSLYMLMVDGFINGLGGSPPVQEVFQEILSKMN